MEHAKPAAQWLMDNEKRTVDDSYAKGIYYKLQRGGIRLTLTTKHFVDNERNKIDVLARLKLINFIAKHTQLILQNLRSLPKRVKLSL